MLSAVDFALLDLVLLDRVEERVVRALLVRLVLLDFVLVERLVLDLVDFALEVLEADFFGSALLSSLLSFEELFFLLLVVFAFVVTI